MVASRVVGHFVAAFLIAGAVVGCSDALIGDSVMQPKLASGDADIVASSYQAAERLLHGARQPMDLKRPILVASLVNVANLQQSSNLGRIISEQISSRLSQMGYETREMKFRGSFLIRRGQGEFVLSRALLDISKEQEAQAVVVGVYAVAKTGVYLTLKLIRAEDSVVIGSYDYRLPLGPDAMALLEPFDS